MKTKSLLGGEKIVDILIMRACILLLLFVFVLLATTVGAAAKTYEEYVSSLPAGCEPVPRECFNQAVKEGQLNIYDWAEWWPEELFTGFQKEFGIKIVRDNFANYDEALTKFKLYPNAPYDWWYGTPRQLTEAVAKGLLHEFNHSWIPNVNKYMRQDAKNANWAPGYKYFVNITLTPESYVINTRFIDKNDPRIPSFKFVFEGGETYKGRLAVREDYLRVIGNTLKYLGYSVNSTDKKELMEAKKALMKLKPYIKMFDSWPKRAVMAEEIWIVMTTPNDFVPLDKEMGRGVFYACWPPEGCFLSPNGFMIPKGGGHPAAAHLWTNYIYRPDKCGLLIESIGFPCAHNAIDKYLSDYVRKWITIPQEYVSKCEGILPQAYTGEGEKLRAEIWEELKR